MWEGADATLDAAGLEVEDIQDHREDAVDDDDEHDGRDHGRRGGEAHGRRAPPRLHAPEAADEGNDHAEHRALADADEEARQAHGPAGLLEILGRAESQHAHADHGAAQDPDEIRVDRQQRHHQDQGEHPRQDEELHRRDAHGGERVDLLVGGHRPELRGECRAGPARHDDGRHDAADLARHRNGHQVRDEERGAELLELHGSDETENEPDQEADEADDAERSRPALLDDGDQVDHPEARAAAHQRAQGEDPVAEERETCHGLGPGGGCPGADPDEPRRPLAGAAGVPLGHGLGEAQQPLGTLREARPIGLDAASLALLEYLDRKGHEARVPLGDPARVEREPMNGRSGLDLAPDVGGIWQPVLFPPHAGELDAGDLRHRASEVKRPGALRAGC